MIGFFDFVEGFVFAGVVTCCIITPLIFFTAYVNGGFVMVSINSFGEAVLKAGAGLSNRDPDEIVTSDTKTYLRAR